MKALFYSEKGCCMTIGSKSNGNDAADERIIELYWHRDENAITETDKKYGKMLFNIAYNITFIEVSNI